MRNRREAQGAPSKAISGPFPIRMLYSAGSPGPSVKSYKRGRGGKFIPPSSHRIGLEKAEKEKQNERKAVLTE